MNKRSREILSMLIKKKELNHDACMAELEEVFFMCPTVP